MSLTSIERGSSPDVNVEQEIGVKRSGYDGTVTNSSTIEVQQGDREVDGGHDDTSQPSPTFRSSLAGYAKSGSCIELFFCVLYVLFGGLVPIYAIPLNSRPIPYQLTAAGDVILELSLNHDLVSETIPPWLLFVLAVLLPFVIQCALSFFVGLHGDLHRSICSYMVGFGSTLLITDTLKNYVGRLRPNFYHYCDFNAGSHLCARDGVKWRQSFPSGHSSISFCGLLLLALYLWRLVDVKLSNAGRGTVCGSSKRFMKLAALCPMLLATFIAASRVVNNFHFPSDIIAGSLIGSVCAVVGNFLWFDYPSTSVQM